MVGGFTGTQEGTTQKQRERLCALWKKLRVRSLHHGDCVGSDAEAHALARERGFHIVVHPPTNSQKRAFCVGDEVREPLDYLVRDKNIANEVQVLFATPKGYREETRSGTWATVRYGIAAKKPVYVIYPDGSYVKR